MGSGSPIDDLVESGTTRLLDWNDSMTDIQLGMRFVDKVQAISAVCKWSISVGCEYRVVKSKMIHGPQDVTITVMIITVHVANELEIHMSNIIQEVQCVEKMGQEQILMCQRYIRDKRIKELTKRIFIRY
ncbi:hypothetical protein M9H77_22007 [Catharanthus roseus]|uniref:Uncharacterized protein n=1 Tax=Catharanthus roseus TaxID=4058 RepID=A0ACC0ARA1_CATRO|nr:hypothetical protein M9H77_22007 [Catharanthus roseus]